MSKGGTVRGWKSKCFSHPAVEFKH